MAKVNQETPFNTTFSKTVNSISLENTEPLIEHTLNRYPTLSTRKSEAISDPGTILTTNLFHKPRIYETAQWNVSQERGTPVTGGNIAQVFESFNDSPGGQNLRGNMYFRSGLRLEAKLSSSPFHSGKLVFYYIPAGISQFENIVYRSVQYPCTYLDAGNSTTAVLDIPFFAIKDFFATQNGDEKSDLGNFSIDVLNPLAIGTGGPTSVELTITAIPTQNQIALPVRGHDISLQSSESLIPALSDPQKLIPEIGNIQSGDLKTDQLLKSIFQMISDSGSSKTPSVPPLTTYLEKPEMMPAHDSPNNTTTDPAVNTSAPTLSNVTGINSEHLSLIPEQTMMREVPTGEMDLKLVTKEPSLIAITRWLDTDNSGTRLIAIPVDPMVSPVQASATSGFATVYPTYLAYSITPFSYWNGSIDYTFTFAATEQHKGKILASWVPNDVLLEGNVSAILGASPTIDQLSLYPCEVFDLTLNKEFTFSVPYNSETPYKLVYEDYIRFTEATEKPVSGTSTSTETSLGVLYLYVFNKLSHPTTVTSTIEFNTYIKAGKDFDFRALKFTDDPFSNYQKIDYITLQSADITLESTRDGMRKHPANRVGVSPALSIQPKFQEDDSETKLGILLQKFYPIVAFSTTLDAESTRTISFASTPGMNIRLPTSTATPPLPDPRWRNLIAHFRDIFAFWQGSLNYFIIHNTTVNNPVILMASHDPTDFQSAYQTVTTRNVNGYGVPIGINAELDEQDTDLSETCIYSHISNLRVNPTIEVTTPHRSVYRRLYTSRVALDLDRFPESRDTGRIDIVYSNPSAEEQSVSGLLYQSIGDDFQFKYLIPPNPYLSRFLAP